MNGMMKRHFVLLLALLICASLFPATALAEGESGEPAPVEDAIFSVLEQEQEDSSLPEDGIQEVVIHGTLGGDLIWMLDDNMKLTISGSGAMPDFGYYGDAPWRNYRAQVLSIEMHEGITKIGDQAFLGCSSITSVKIPESVIIIGDDAFNNCTDLHEIVFIGHAPSFGNNCFYNVTATVQYPDDGTWIDSVFQNYGGNLTWAQDIGTVLFDPNGGTVATVSKVVMKDHPYGELPIPERTGYCFVGWHTAKEGGELVTAETVVQTTESHTLYAHWSANMYNVFFDANGGTVFPETITVAYGKAYGDLPIPERMGYRFAGWYTTAEDGELVTAEMIVQTLEDHTLFAHWTVNTYIVSYDANGGEGAPEAQTKTHDMALTLSTALPTRASIPEERFVVTLDPNGGSVSNTSLTAERTTSYSFNTWNTSADGNGEAFTAGATFTLNCDTTLFAQWNSTTVTSKVTLPTPFRNGYSFKGWATSPTATGGVFDGYTPSENVILYAIWEKKSIASGTCGDNLTWLLYEDGILSISGSGDMWDWENSYSPWYGYRESILQVIFPDDLTSIGSQAFFNCKSLTRIELPDSVTRIGSYAFQGCSSLASIRIPDGITRIEDCTFYACDALDLTLPEGVTSIGNSAFYLCNSLKSVTIPEGVISIGFSAFRACSGITKVSIPTSVTSIEGIAFGGCDSLTEITVAEGNPSYASCDGILYNKTMTELVQYPGGKSGDLSLPSSVTSIGYHAFDGCNEFTSVIIPEGITSIEEAAFTSCRNLITVVLPEGLTSIGGSIFSGCNVLSSVVLPSTLTTIGEWAFSSCWDLPSVEIPKEVTSIGDHAFYNCRSLKTICFKGSAPTIGKSCFSGVKAQALYPANIGSWTQSVRQNYGGYITWVPYYSIAFDANGGEGAPDNQIKANNLDLTLPTDQPTRADDEESFTITLDAQGGRVEQISMTTVRTTSYTFTAWNTAADGSGDSYAPGDTYTANAAATLYAQWDSRTTTAPVTLPTPTREGYSFHGWATSTTAVNGVTGSYTPEESLTLYAIWEKIPDGTIQLGDKAGRSGDEILVPVILDNELGMYVISFHVNYDSAVLKLVGVEDGSLSGWRCSTNSSYVRWDASEDSDEPASGVIAKLRFQVIEDAEDGVTDVTIDDLEILNRDEYEFFIAVIPGTVSVNSRIAGDANGDGEVDILDLIRLLTGDGKVNNADLVRLRKYLVGVAVLE